MDLMFELLELLLPLVIYWRIGVSGLIALVTAVVLAVMIGPFTAMCGIAVVLVGLGAGMLWEMDAAKSKVQAAATGNGD